MNRREKLEQQKNYYINQAEKNSRISEHSLDSENKRTFKERPEQNRKKAEKIAENIDKTVEKSGESGIIEETNIERFRRLSSSISSIEQEIDKLDSNLLSIENEFYDKYDGFFDNWSKDVQIEFSRAGDLIREKIDKLDTKLKSIIHQRSEVEVKAVKELAYQIKDMGGFRSVKIDDCTFDSAEEIHNALKMCFDKTPKLRGMIRELRLEKMSDLNDFAYTVTLIENGYKTDSICLNKSYFSDIENSGILEKLKHDVANGHHPIGCETPNAIIAHEIGHVIENYQRNNKLPLLYLRNKRNLLDEIGVEFSDESIAKGLSKYATKNSGKEFVAEAWSEFVCSTNPRPIAKAVGDFIMKQFR